MEEKFVLGLSKKELIDLYLALKQDELRLGESVAAILMRLEKELYSLLTIDELEKIQRKNEYP
ncbi:MAG: hypothetical protein JW881_09930 [Spirochaetales bacterium]|nr:hypothetical protein [Spirochaetales bacterium]